MQRRQRAAPDVPGGNDLLHLEQEADIEVDGHGNALSRLHEAYEV